MSYLIGKMLICLLLALLLGAIIGWILRGMRAKKEDIRLQGYIDQAQGDLLKTRQYNDQIDAELTTLRSSSSNEISALQGQVAELEPLRKRVSDSQVQLNAISAQATQRSKTISHLKAEAEQSLQEKTALQAQIAELAPLRNQAREAQQQIEQLSLTSAAERDKANRDNGRLLFRLNQTAPLQARLTEQEKSAQSLHSVIQQKDQEISSLQANLDKQAAQHKSEAGTLQRASDGAASDGAASDGAASDAAASDAAATQGEQTDLVNRDIREQATTIERLQTQIKDHEALQQQVTRTQAQLDLANSALQQCKDDSAARDAENRKLGAQIQALSNQPKVTSNNVTSAQSIHPSEPSADTTSAAKTPLFTAPAEKDDLKKIYGIGPVLEGVLNELGVTSFKQIANFTRDDVARVTAAIDTFPDRIDRDDWIGGATNEHQKKYGRSPN